MKWKNLALLGSALFGIPAVFAALAFADARLELGIMHSILYSGIALFGFVLAGLYLLWLVSFRARWQRFAAAVAYAPAMFVFLSWFALVIQFTFDDRMAQQAVAADRAKPRSG